MSTKKLSCGGNGPCCHVGYSHRHCEHCDVVIDTRPINVWPLPWLAPYQPWPRQIWVEAGVVGGTQNVGGNHFNNLAAAGVGANPTFIGNTADFTKALPEHVCEVNT